MPKSTESVNKDLKDLLDAKGFKIIMKTSGADDVPIPEEADVFQFKFKSGDKDYGTVAVTIDGLKDLVVYYNNEVNKAKSKNSNTGWLGFIGELKKFALNHSLGFKLSDEDKLGQDMKVRDHNKKLDEGYYGTRHTSYSDNSPPSIKMILKHNKALDEGDARYRFVERIFLENEHGERVLVPSTRPGIGRVFARHLAEGGQHNDQRWQHIAEMVQDSTKLGGFVRATRNGQYNESVEGIISEATNHYHNLRETLKRLQSSRGYNQYFESWTPTIMESSDDEVSLIEMFRNSSVDSRIEGAIPVLRKLNLPITETADVSMFEDWADGILGEMLKPALPGQQEALIDLLGPDSDFMPLGPDASNAIGELSDVLDDDRLNARLRKAADRDTNRDARAIIIGWMSEQAGEEYDDILNKIEPGSDAEEPEEPPVHDADQPEEAPPEEPDADTDEQGPADADGFPDVSDLPEPPAPVKENVSRLKRVQDNRNWRDPNIKMMKTPMELDESLLRLRRLSGLE